jgi:Rrf2 family cysteine metabolism transcriptional repressor
MKLSLRSEYALLSLIHLSRHADSKSSAEEIAVSQHIPVEALTDILAALARASYLQSINNGYKLAKPADKTPVAEIIRLFDGALAPLEPVSEKGYQPAPMEKEEKLIGLFSQLQEQIVDKLESTTLADLV